ncbi:MAG: hypothetical protein AAF581_11770 [Planctomycetota bacterium]
MRSRTVATWTLVAAGILLWGGGCLTRKEGLTVHEDGSITVVHEISGDAGDLNGGAAQLPLREPFAVRRFVREKSDGKKEHCAIAEATYRSAAAMPQTFAGDNAPYREASLHFTNHLSITEHDDGVHYVFVRRYIGRDWGRYAFDRKRAFPEHVEKLLDQGPIEKLQPDEQRTVLAAFADYERRKLHIWLERALDEVGNDDNRWRVLLQAGAAIDQFHKEQLVVDRLVTLLELPSNELEKQADSLMQSWLQRAKNTATAGLSSMAARERFEERFALYRHDFEVSEDLRDENFELRVQMPGTVVHSNGVTTGSTTQWQFSGQELCLGDRVLVVESVVAKP